jgi:transposase
MARAYSSDLCEQVAVAVAEERSCRRVAKLFRVGVSSGVKCLRRYRQTGSAAARPVGGVRRKSFGLAARAAEAEARAQSMNPIEQVRRCVGSLARQFNLIENALGYIGMA